MKATASLVAFAAIAASSAIAGSTANKPDVVAFNANVRVEVDAAGKPLKVEAPADLPQAVRGFIEKRVASWQYEPAKENGIAAPAVTFVNVGACAIPLADGSGFSLGLDFKGNGPRIIDASDRMQPPPYPRDAMVAGVEGAFRITYAIQPDGSTKLESIDPLPGTGGGYARSFRTTLTQWAAGMRYQPELVNGKAVPTRMSFPVIFEVASGKGGGSAWRDAYLAELKARAVASKECMAASGAGGMMPIALDSPVKITPTPAG